jgi:hypothetical protein
MRERSKRWKTSRNERSQRRCFRTFVCTRKPSRSVAESQKRRKAHETNHEKENEKERKTTSNSDQALLLQNFNVSVNTHRSVTATETKNKVEGRLLLDVVVRKSATVLELLAGEDQALLVRGNALLVLDLSLDIVDGVGRLDLEGDLRKRMREEMKDEKSQQRQKKSGGGAK